MNVSGLELNIIWKLKRHRWIGKKHTSFDNLKKGFPKNIESKIKSSYDHLKKLGIIQEHPTSYGKQISLNPKQLDTVYKACDLFQKILLIDNAKEVFDNKYEI
jgi:hypothetical protein